MPITGIPLSPSEYDLFCRWSVRIGLNRMAASIGVSRPGLQRIQRFGRATEEMRARLVAYLTTEPPPSMIPCPGGCGASVPAGAHNALQGAAPCPPCRNRRRAEALARHRKGLRRPEEVESAQLLAQQRLLEALALGPATIAECLSRLDLPTRNGPAYGWAAVQLQTDGKVRHGQDRPYVWSLTSAPDRAERQVDGATVAWRRHRTAGGTLRWEVSAHAPGCPRYTLALPERATPEERQAAERRAVAACQRRAA